MNESNWSADDNTTTDMKSEPTEWTTNNRSEPEHKRKLFLGGLSYSTTEENLRSHFEQWGEVVDCVVMRNPTTKQPRGFGFVTYATIESVDECQKNRPHKIDNRTIQPKRAVPRDLTSEPNSEASVRKIFIGGLKDDVTEDDLRSYFEQYGVITDVLVAADRETKKSRGFGFVEFDDYDPVDKLIMDTHHEVKGKKVNIKKAVSKDQIQSKRSGPQNNGWGPGNGYNGYNGGGYGMGNGYGRDNGNWNPAWGNAQSMTSGPGPMRGGGANNYRSGPYDRNGSTRGGGYGGGGRY